MPISDTLRNSPDLYAKIADKIINLAPASNDVLTLDKFKEIQLKIPTNPCREMVAFNRSYYEYKPIKNSWEKDWGSPQFSKEFLAEYIEGTWNMGDNTVDNKTPHSERLSVLGLSYGGQQMLTGKGLSAKVDIEDESVTLSIDLPGVEYDRISVRRLDSTLRVQVFPEDPSDTYDLRTQSSTTRTLEYILAEYEHVEDIELDLGVLSIHIARDRDIEDFDIG